MRITVKLTRAENTALLGAGPVELDLEEYLLGVVPSEIYESSHIEALKAQAVAARTFAVKRAMAGTVVDDTTSFQAYRAPLAESSPRSRQAVTETAGQVLTYGGEIIDCFYSASNGGTCKRSGEVWSRDYPYYVNKPDPWDTAAREEKPTSASHGVGLSQVGCMWAARQEIPYNEILAFYYDGAALVHEYGTGSVVGFEEETGGEIGMKLVESFLTKNPCYTAGRKITVKGLMLHSVGCPQPKASAFINSWNSPSYDNACVHGFIDGNDGTVYQTLPWNHRGWHCGSGSKGSGNNTHIGVEMCEPACIKYTGGATFTCSDLATARKVAERTYNAAVELFAMLCKQYGLNPLSDGVVISHKEGHSRGIASNHGDPEHLWTQLGMGYTMNTFRQAVKAKMAGGTSSGTLYRVRKSWGDASSQLGAFAVLDNAKALADKNPGYAVFDENGKQVYPSASGSTGTGTLYRVRKSWSDAASQKGAFHVLDNAKRCADENPGYSVFDEAGKVVYTGAAASATYTVQKGDSLWAIAAEYLGNGTRYTEIKKLNGLTSDVIYAGQVLKLPNK
ncbi:SpoIID/LytB domain-containing protein [Eubacterium callanderi]|uniref:N-acetylmuramoyl-L-alanine amidase n=2 Tax=Eubacterium callanderi TaxID=53442 RepID=A0A853JIP1_9FIRM|nr:SpoIID/LytB domain-containing protein [Eubacterium callanderi]